MNLIKIEDVQDKVLILRNEQVIIDSDVAKLYGVETKRINEAVRNNPDKFPEGYVLALTKEEWINLKTNFSTSSWGGKNKIPNAFTERGLYMLATILKGRQAVQTTLCIIDTFVKLRELSKTMASIQNAEDGKTQKKLLQKGGEILSDIMGDNLDIAESETEFEINFAMIKLKHRITRKK